MAYVKGKYNFTLKGVKYKDINGYNYDNTPNNININVSGTAQMVRQWIKQKYPQILTSYYWVRSESYSGGDSIKVYFNNAPKELYEKLNRELNMEFEEGTFNGMDDSYTYTKEDEKSAEGLTISYGTKYLFVRNQPPSDVKVEPVDWNVSTASKTMTTKSSVAKPSYSIGEVLKDCAGWIVSKKTLPDGRVVYSAKIKPDTPVNKDQWQEIKNEVYTQTGFKWGRFGAFEKWGVIASEAYVVKTLCDILDKYYPSQAQSQAPLAKSQSQPQKPRNFMVGDMFYSKDYPNSKYYIKSVNSDGEVGFASLEKPDAESIYGTEDEVSELFEKGQWVKDGRYDYGQTEPQKSKEDIQKAINGLKYLADKGNEKAAKAIKGLEYLLNK